jgi:hypothetical protein
VWQNSGTMTAAPRLARTVPLWRTVLYVVGAVALLLVVVTHIPATGTGSRACTDVGTGLPFPPNTVDHPYGTVRSCKVLDSRTPLFTGLDYRLFLLLDTDTGAVAVRVDYRDTSMGRQYRAEAVELTATRTPNLFAAEARQLQRSIDGRGGIRAQVWVVHYGDG